MPVVHPLRQYQQQAVLHASPAELIDKLYSLGLAAAHRGDAVKTRRVLVELIGGLDTERGGDLAERLHSLYDYALRMASDGDLAPATTLLSQLRDAWREGVLGRPALAA